MRMHSCVRQGMYPWGWASPVFSTLIAFISTAGRSRHLVGPFVVLAKKSIPQRSRRKHRQVKSSPVRVLKILQITNRHNVLVLELLQPFVGLVRWAVVCHGRVSDKVLDRCIRSVLWIVWNIVKKS